ncbi:Chaperone SurA [Neolewinella maritima]|uniref:peptidylprolyl isomerase n=1 Tax=Neolewinella maritima TaxID=1383882 RepID=A0ABN8F2E0_9BACT|nr:peptidylprolyl isomerase [Neolewinella maritima]CAH0999283.1 Chaperone SurA [Neolewinella maritima]
MIKCIFGLAVTLLFTLPLSAQDDSEVLFTVAGKPVTVGEFRYIYTKTNGEDATFSRESVMEYLDLYERFKLKVARAHDMGLDTVVALQNELEGYRKQLADNYLLDREVTDPLVEQLYIRKQQDVDFSHILFNVPSDRPADTLAVFERAQQVRQQLTADNFAQQAGQLSEDTYSKDRGGRIGYVSAPLPNGMHRLEEALWAAQPGKVYGPVRTAAGYHLFVRHASRPAYGQVEIAHILIRKGEDAGADTEPARERAMQAAAALEAGTPFEEVAATYSEDDKTRNQGGYIGFFGINRYNKDFEQAAFALTEDGQVSEVIESPVGFHILKRVSRRGVQPLEEQRPLLEATVRQDSRFAAAQRALLQRLRRQYGTDLMDQNLATYTATLDSSFFDVRKTFATDTDLPLLRIGDNTLTVSDFNDYLTRNGRRRATLQRSQALPEAVRVLFDAWVEQEVQRYAEQQLEVKFPDFRALMREYREGILLFEATKLEVWDKAGTDSTGLEEFFAAHREQYQFAPRARVQSFRIRVSDSLQVADVLAYADGRTPEEIMEYFGRQDVAVEEERYEADRLPEDLSMEVGSQTDPEQDPSGTVRVYRVAAVEPARPKELQEARGYVIADYQDQLEREWVDALRKTYEVKVNKNVLNKLIAS